MISRLEVALEIFTWGLEMISRRDCGLLLAGFRVCEADRRLTETLNPQQRAAFIEAMEQIVSTFTLDRDKGRPGMN